MPEAVPPEIESFFEKLPGSSQAFKLGTTDGIYVVKFREMAESRVLGLARETLAGLLAAELDVQVPEARPVRLTQAYLDLEPRLVFGDGTRPAPGLASGSRFLPRDENLPVDHTARLASCPPADMAGVLAFNTWVGCGDRGWHNYAFAIDSAVVRFASIDYASAFARSDGEAPRVTDISEVQTAATASWADVTAAIVRIEALADETIDRLVDAVPDEFWSQTERDLVVAMLRTSRARVRSTLERIKP